MKTAGVRALVHDVLDSLPAPYSEHIIDEVLFAIESNPAWRLRYDALCDALEKPVVNQWCGQWTGDALGKTGQRQLPSRKNTLTDTYSLLDTDVLSLRSPTRDEATALLAAYYRETKERWPATIREQRENIIDWVMHGRPVNEAFELALQQLTPRS